jgi:hypothetical protein
LEVNGIDSMGAAGLAARGLEMKVVAGLGAALDEAA